MLKIVVELIVIGKYFKALLRDLDTFSISSGGEFKST
jgi:hypothetical protein